jgi:hypothetical protein
VAQALRRCARGLVVVAALAGFAPACAHRIGKEAARGAAAEMRRQSNSPDGPPMQVAGANAVEGAVRALDAPEQRAAIDRMITQAVSAAATAAVRDATQQFIEQLGPDGQGPLAVSLTRTSERVSASAVGSVGGELARLLPECAGPDQMGCIERRLQQTARTTAASFTTGIKDSVGWQFLLIAFALGVGGGAIGAWLWSLRGVRRRTLRTA